jgi:hypothetical protein
MFWIAWAFAVIFAVAYFFDRKDSNLIIASVYLAACYVIMGLG